MSQKILIYSIKEEIRNKIKLFLGDHYDLILCDSLEMCLDVIRNAEIKTLLLDVNDQDEFFQFIGKIKSNNPPLKIIILITSNMENLVKKAIKAGANDHLFKPIRADELLAICNK